MLWMCFSSYKFDVHLAKSKLNIKNKVTYNTINSVLSTSLQTIPLAKIFTWAVAASVNIQIKQRNIGVLEVGWGAEQISVGMMTVFWGERELPEFHWGLEAGNQKPTWPLTSVGFPCFFFDMWLCLPLLNNRMTCLVCLTLFVYFYTIYKLCGRLIWITGGLSGCKRVSVLLIAIQRLD